jgi:hypothetical protein
MTLTANPSEALAIKPELDPFFKDISPVALGVRTRDDELIALLHEKHQGNERYFSEPSGLWFANQEIARMADRSYKADALSRMEVFLNEKSTLIIPTMNGFTVMVDGIRHDITIVTATAVSESIPNHGDMSSMLYLRDHVQAASALMELYLQSPDQYAQEGSDGRTLLLSALHLMSTPSQIERFDDVIKRGDEAGQADWPHISLHFGDMEGILPNNWRNKQDTFQMLAFTTLDAIDRGFISVDDLEESHKKFLGSIVPFLKSVGFPKYESSGSWEEIAANRTSVMAVETALLHKIKKLTESSDDFAFLQDGYDNAKANLPATNNDFTQTLDTMLDEGLTEIGRRLPYESPDYNADSVKFREADVALAYVLMYNLPELLADANVLVGPSAKTMTVQEIEAFVLNELSTLFDAETNGIIRYEKDSYQEVNFHTDGIQWIIKAIKNIVKKDADETGQEINLDKKQALRGNMTPKGKAAAWTHPLGQLSAWAASRSLTAMHDNTPDEAALYRDLSTQFLNRSLSTITGENQWHATLDENGQYTITQVPPYKLPECNVSYKSTTGEIFSTPSPHTPLNWSSAMTKQAIGLLKISTQLAEKAA